MLLKTFPTSSVNSVRRKHTNISTLQFRDVSRDHIERFLEEIDIITAADANKPRSAFFKRV